MCVLAECCACCARIPRELLPRIVPSRLPRSQAGRLHPSLDGVPVHAVMADSHAALFAHGAYAPGDVKATMGTGSSVNREVTFKSTKVDQLTHELAQYKCLRFGKSSEKLDTAQSSLLEGTLDSNLAAIEE